MQMPLTTQFAEQWGAPLPATAYSSSPRMAVPQLARACPMAGSSVHRPSRGSNASTVFMRVRVRVMPPIAYSRPVGRSILNGIRTGRNECLSPPATWRSSSKT